VHPQDDSRSRKALLDFLRDAFSMSEFRELIAREYGRSMVSNLPDHPTPTDFFAGSIDVLARHGLLTPGFFQQLADARPARRPEILAMSPEPAIVDKADAKLDVVLSGSLTDLNPTRLENFIQTVREIAGDRALYVLRITSGSIRILVRGTHTACLQFGHRYREAPNTMKRWLEARVGLSLLGLNVVTVGDGHGPTASRATLTLKILPRSRWPHDHLTDQELLAGWRRGDPGMGSTLFARHSGKVTALLRNDLRDSSEIEDLTHETFLDLMNNKGEVKNVSEYLYIVAFRKLTRYLRKKKGGPQLSDDSDYHDTIADEIEPDALAYQNMREEQSLLVQALRSIPLALQQTLELYVWENKKGWEIAAMLRIPESTVRGRIRRADALLRDRIRVLTATPGALRTTPDTLDEWRRRVQESLDLDSPGEAPPPRRR